jgi:hypothetical protein
MSIRRSFPKFILVLAVIGVTASISGCVTTSPRADSQNASVSVDKGLVFVRVSIEGLKYADGLTVLARPTGGGDTTKFRGWSVSSDGYWSTYYDEAEKGELVAMPLPPGEYEFFSIAASAGGMGGVRVFNSTKDFSYRFRVQAGEYVYLGNLLTRVKADSGVTPSAGSKTVVGIEHITRDTRARDLKEIEKRFPGVAPDKILVRLLK